MRETTLLQRVIKTFGISALTVLFFACPAEPDDNIQILVQYNKATVSFSVADSSERTVLPQVSLADVASYKLLGGINNETETVLVESFTGTGTSVSLDPGTWNFTLNAYNSSGAHILQGKVQNKQINLTGTNQVSFSLSVINSGTGSVQITLNFPETAGITKISANGDVASENFTSITNGTFVYTKNGITAGDYLINFGIYCGDVLRTVVSELVVVRSSLTSSKTITLVGEDLKPVLTGTVNIIETAVVGGTLAADTGALNGTGAMSYQWKRGTTNIGTNTNTYTVQAADVGGTITVTVTRDGYVGVVTSSPTAAVPALTSVTLSSVTADGSSTQTTTVLTLSFSPAITNLTASDITLTHSVSGQSFVKGVPTASGSSYTLPISGFTSGGILSVAVAKPGYTINGSPKTGINIYCFSPPLAGTVGINGTLKTGQTLTADTNYLGGNGTITYEWRRGTTVVGTNSSTYTVVAADVSSTNFTLRVTRAGYSGYVDSSSMLTGTVSITGTAQSGQTLTAVTNSLGGSSGDIFYQWKRGGTAISGATGSTYTLQTADADYTITVTVTRSGYSGYITSSATATITLPVLTGTVSITGTAHVGQTLTASTSNLGGSGTTSYQWKRGGTAISGATGSTYTLVAADVGYTITVTVTRPGYSGITSSPTAAVILPPLTGTVSITGTVQVGQTLTANTSSLGGSGTISYQWSRGGTAISGATGSTYTVQAADLDNTLTVTVTRSGYSGSITSTSVSVVTVLPFSTTIEGSITATNTVNKYMVTLAQSGTLTLSLTSPGGTTALPNNGADVKWYNSSNTLISGGTSSGFSFPYTEDKTNLAAGTYYIEIVGRTGVGNTGKYNIRADYYKDEVEPNNTTANAQVLVPGLTVKGSITSSDTDMYKYVLSEPGRLTVNVAKGTISYIYVRWYNNSGTRIRNDEVYYSSSWPYNQYMDLEAGTYYIGVEQDSNSTGTYNLRSDFTAAENNEATATTEPSNNTLATAQVLTSGQTVKGFISYQDDKDMFKYVLTEPGRLTVNVAKGSISYIYVRWYNNSGTQIRNDEVYYSSSWPYNQYMDLEAGTYYIGIEQESNSTGTYNLSADFTAAGNNETEPNTERVNAQVLTSGQTVKGFISYQDGTDMYRIVLTQSKTVTVNVTKGTISYIYVRWYDADGTRLRNDEVYYSSSWPYNQSISLAAGTYYIGIEQVSSSTGTYNLKVTW
jgi:hypothetical protein